MAAHIHINGNVGADPELKEISTANGPMSVLKIVLASNPKPGKGGEKRENEDTTWHVCEIFGKRATALAPHIRKGDPLYVHGEQVTQFWIARESGDKRTKNVVKVTDLEFGKTRRERDSEPAKQSGDDFNFDDAPF